jgi:hypothetical protein
VLVKALDKLTEEELASLFAILKDGAEKKTSKHPPGRFKKSFTPPPNLIC